jgi:hypothetical protein
VIPAVDEGEGPTTTKQLPPAATQPTQPRKRGRPPRSKNKRKVQYLTRKEEDNYVLAVKLRNNSIINTLGASFKASN